MGVYAYAWAWAQTLDPTDKLLLLAIADHINSETNCAFPSVRRLMRFTGLSERHVRRCLASLEERKFIEKRMATDNSGRQMSNVYRFRTEFRPVGIGRGTDEEGVDLSASRRRFQRTLEGERREDDGMAPDAGDRGDANGKADLFGTDDPDAGDRGVGANGGTPRTVITNRNTNRKDDWPVDAWEQFWAIYPNKVGKPVAMKSFEKARLRFPVWAEFWAGVLRYVNKTDDRSWLNPSTFLNQDRAGDMPAALPVRGGGPGRQSFMGAARAAMANGGFDGQ